MQIKWSELTKGIFRENPIFVVVLGLCPTLAVSTQTINGIGMGIAVIFVLTFSNLLISLLRKWIPNEVRIPAYISIIASFVTIVSLLMQAFTPDLSRALGIFIPLIVVNCIILGRAEAFASKNDPLHSIFDGIGMGLGFSLSLTVIAFIREILGSGTITLQLAGVGPVISLKNIISDPAVVFILPPGGFIVLGLLLAFFQYLKNKKQSAKKPVQAQK
ncbi:MAG: electron transport complex subunit RsxE [Brevinematia bacterium]